MNYFRRLLVLSMVLLVSGTVFSQAPISDSVMNFTVRNVGKNRIIIGWVNPFENVVQISVQQSADSAGAYKTILTVADPNAVQNGFAYTKAPSDRMFYRLFVVLDKAVYHHTAAKRPIKDTMQDVRDVPVALRGRDTSAKNSELAKAFESLIPPPSRDSLFKNPPPAPKPVFVLSNRVFTNRDGAVMIKLPDAEQKKYNLKFFEEDGSLIFELNNVKTSSLTLDKSNFYHAGWFHFELYSDEKLIEKNKIFINKAF